MAGIARLIYLSILAALPAGRAGPGGHHQSAHAIDVIERGDPDSLGGYVLLIALAAAGGGLLRGVSRAIIFNAGRNVESTCGMTSSPTSRSFP